MELPFPVDWFAGGYALGLFVMFVTWGMSRVWLLYKGAIWPF
jgi:hypothetical protein